MNLNKIENETELQYIWRICSAKDAGTISMTWDELADIFNRNLREDDEFWSSSAYRKKFQQAKAFYEEVFSKMESEAYSQALANQKRELSRLKIQFRDERNAWNKQNYADARIEQNLDIIQNKLAEIGKVTFTDYSKVRPASDNDVVVCASDWHIGETFNNAFGNYNSDTAKNRLDKLLAETIRIGKLNGSENVWVVFLGDELSGNIHLSIQVSNRENLIEQVKLSAELAANFIAELSKSFNHVYVVGAVGNHSRLVVNKDADIKDERLDNLILWIVKQMTLHLSNVTVYDKNRDTGIAEFTIRGHKYVGVHGDNDSMTQNSVGKLCMMLEYMPTAIIGGHRHTPAYQEFNGVKYIQSGSLAGSGDDFTLSKRLSGKPNQTILVCNEYGIESIHNIEV